MDNIHASANGSIRVLIVDDHAVVRQGLRTFLELQDGSELRIEVVGEAANGTRAVELAQHTQPDIVLLDLVMAEMDGIQATRIIRETLTNQPIIIALTANTMHGDQEECLNAGMNDYIGKPLKLEEVVAKLEKWALHKMTG